MAVTAGQTGYVTVAFGFTGRYFDTFTGLQNNLHRWYDPAVGRWLSEDPIGFAGGDANLYRYVGNSPTMYVDPSGLAVPDPNLEWLALNGVPNDDNTPLGRPQGDGPHRLPPIDLPGEWHFDFDYTDDDITFEFGVEPSEDSNFLDDFKQLPLGSIKPIPGTKPIFGVYQPTWKFDGDVNLPSLGDVLDDPGNLFDPDKWELKLGIGIGIDF